MQTPLQRLPRALVITAGVLTVLSGCGQAPETATTQKIAVCISPTEAMPAGKDVAVELRQGNTVVGTASTSIGGVFEAEVPIGTDIEVYADGELVGAGGSSGGNMAGDDGPALYMSGPGCPSSPTGSSTHY